jgi:Fe2+ transport system protein B
LARRRRSSALVFGKTVLKGVPGRWCSVADLQDAVARDALLAAKDQGLSFLKTAGTVIMVICIIMWWLSAYPRVGPTPEAQALRAQAEQTRIAQPEQSRG